MSMKIWKTLPTELQSKILKQSNERNTKEYFWPNDLSYLLYNYKNNLLQKSFHIQRRAKRTKPTNLSTTKKSEKRVTNKNCADQSKSSKASCQFKKKGS